MAKQPVCTKITEFCTKMFEFSTSSHIQKTGHEILWKTLTKEWQKCVFERFVFELPYAWNFGTFRATIGRGTPTFFSSVTALID